MSDRDRSPQSHDRDKNLPEKPNNDPPIALNYAKAAQTTLYPNFTSKKIQLTDSTIENEYTGPETHSRRPSIASSTSSLQSLTKLAEKVNQNLPKI
ncbi:hypothetical protein JTB14_017182 [Gonioctena quinquepunctata]|nr:hypothetical protein JTB14_017182 [Gonioctena quinquepunctata]